MPNFVFVCEHEAEEDYPGRRNMVEFSAESWDEVVNEMTDFLRGCGYQFKGQLEMAQPEEHSKHFYDTTRNR